MSTQSSDSPNSESQPTIKDLSLLARHLRGGFVVTPASLQAFEKVLHEYIRADDESAPLESQCKVQRAGIDTETFASASEAAAIRNPKGNPIVEIQLHVRGVDRNAAISFDHHGRDHGAAIAFAARAASPLTLSKLEQALLAEAAHVRAWYSPIRAMCDAISHQVARIPTWFWAVFWVVWVVVVISFLAASLQRSSTLHDWQKSTATILDQASEFTDTAATPVSEKGAGELTALAAKAEELEELVERSRSIHPVRQSLFNIVLGSIFGIAVLWLIRLFPRLVFAIGEGSKRHEQHVWLRRFVLGSVIITGGVLPIIRAGLGL